MNISSNHAPYFILISFNNPIYTSKGASADVQLNLNFVVETRKEAEASFSVFYLIINMKKEVLTSSSLIQSPTTEFELDEGIISQMKKGVNPFQSKKVATGIVMASDLVSFSHYSNPQGILNLNSKRRIKNVWNTVTF